MTSALKQPSIAARFTVASKFYHTIGSSIRTYKTSMQNLRKKSITGRGYRHVVAAAKEAST
jgi:hypothetical protein